jgi:16S rRNA (cytosine1402-N4)-methyltransferase
MRSLSTRMVEDPYHSAHFHASHGKSPQDGRPVEGLRMSQAGAYAHRPVMRDEVLSLLEPVPPGVYVDATLGGGGHAVAVLSAHRDLSLVGIDRDQDALDAAALVLDPFGDRVTLVHDRFDRLADHVTAVAVSAVLFDLGVSSPQLDRADRGFSYRGDGPLDMRMDRTQALTAADVVNGYDEAELARLFVQNGETRFGRRIARRIVAARPLSTTVELAEVVRDAIPAATRRTGGHPARRTFQAIRIEVNGELRILADAVDAGIDVLVPGGRLVVISYHSGEDRIVKERITDAVTGGCVCPPGMPCVCGAVPRVRLVHRGARKPSAAEIQDNPRAESARLRAVEKL